MTNDPGRKPTSGTVKIAKLAKEFGIPPSDVIAVAQSLRIAAENSDTELARGQADRIRSRLGHLKRVDRKPEQGEPV